MIYFGFKKPFTWQQIEFIADHEHEENFIFEAIGDGLDTSKIYASTSDQIKSFQAKQADNLIILDVKSIDDFPKKMNFKDSSSISGKAVVINLGTAFGDVMHSSLAIKLLVEKNPQLELDIYQLTPSKTKSIYENNPGINETFRLPCKVSDLQKYDYYYDFSGVVLFPGFNTFNLTDFYLNVFGLDSDKVPPEDKVPNLPFKKRQIRSTNPVLFIHTESSSKIRAMPKAKALEIVESLGEEFNIVSADLDHPKVRKIKADSFEEFASYIAGSDAVISIDTAVVHIAAAYNIPAVSIFTTIKPELRTRYYPFNRNIMLESPSGRLYGQHTSVSQDDFDYTEKLWDKLSVDKIIEELRLAMKATSP